MINFKSHRRSLAALGTVLAAVGVAAGSGASFTSNATANPSNTFTSGTLTQTNSKAGAAILSAGNMKPGDVSTGSVTIKNSGTIPGTFTLSKLGATGALLPKLSVVVTDVTNPDATTAVYSGLVSTMTDKALGVFAAGSEHTYKFDVTLASDADNTFQGTTASVEYDWNAIQ